jgi:hypothetical protein
MIFTNYANDTCIIPTTPEWCETKKMYKACFDIYSGHPNRDGYKAAGISSAPLFNTWIGACEAQIQAGYLFKKNHGVMPNLCKRW